MARMNEGDLVTLGPWPSGANNLARETSVPRTSFRAGVNLRVTDDGKVGRREGYTLVAAADEPQSLFNYGARYFFESLGSLYAGVVENGAVLEPTLLHEGLASGNKLAHCLIEPDIYVSDGDVTLRITPENGVLPWSVPDGPDVVAAVADATGGLYQGRYTFAVACKAATGEEGPLGEYAYTEILTENGTLALQLPTPPVGAFRYVVYMTKPNGTELLKMATVPAAAGTLSVNYQSKGAPPVTDGLQAMPAGLFALYYGGRLLVGADSQVIWSEPQQYGLTQQGYNYALFSEKVTGLAAASENTDGFFVGQQSKVYFLQGGDPAEATQREVHGYGMVPHTLAMVPGSLLGIPNQSLPSIRLPVWLSTNGVICVGNQDGTVIPITETRFAARVGEDGASTFMQREGINQLVVTTREASDNNFAVTDSVSIEVVRNGIVL